MLCKSCIQVNPYTKIYFQLVLINKVIIFPYYITYQKKERVVINALNLYWIIYMKYLVKEFLKKKK